MLPSSINATAIASTTTVRERFSVAFAVLFMGILLLFSGTCPAAALPEPAPGTDVNGRTGGAMGTKNGDALRSCGTVHPHLNSLGMLSVYHFSTVCQQTIHKFVIFCWKWSKSRQILLMLCPVTAAAHGLVPAGQQPCALGLRHSGGKGHVAVPQAADLVPVLPHAGGKAGQIGSA